MDLVIDLEKAMGTRGPLNTGKLVRRPVQVRGKNGKIFTRMQWVDPQTGQPAGGNGHAPKLIVQQPQKPAMNLPREDHKEPSVMHADKTKKKTYDLNTQEGHIDHHVDKMDKRDKRDMAIKHGLQWEHNDHDLIEHKNMVVALKEHLKNNPHLVGAEHLPKASSGISETPTGVDDINNWVNNLGKNSPEKLYDLMRAHSILGENDPDPRTVPEYGAKPTGNGMGAIMHMKNMMALKKVLKESPDTMKDSKWDSERIVPHTGEKKSVPAKDHGLDHDFNAQHLLQKMPRAEKYDLAKRLGVAERDPQDVPELVASNKHAVEHARNMTKLAKILERNPELAGDVSKYGVDDSHMNILREKSKHRFLEDDIKSIVGDMPKDMKQDVFKRYSKEPDFPSVPKVESDHPNAQHIRNMHASNAIQKYFSQHPEKFEPYRKAIENHRLYTYPIGNKTMARALKHFFGIKGAGDVMNNHDEESGEREWTFRAGHGSWARVEKRKSGVVLSVVDTGNNDDEWNEYSVPMEKVKNWVDSGEPDTSETPDLHERPLGEIEDALHRNFNHFYTPEVGDALKPTIRGAWEASGYSDDPQSLTKFFHKMNTDDLGKLFDKYGIPLRDGKLNTDSNKFKQFMWGHLIEDNKTKGVHDYVLDVNGKPELFVLHQSASKWSPEELAQGRKELISKGHEIEGADSLPDAGERQSKLVDLAHKGTESIPFDLLSDMMISNGLKVKYATKDSNGNPISGSRYNHGDKTIYLDHSFATNGDLHSIDHPTDLLSAPAKSTHTLDNGEEVSVIPSAMSDDIAHEFAHAMHYHLSGGDPRNGMVNATGKKYLGEHTNVLSASYNTAMKSNPKRIVGTASDGEGKHMYYYHKDHWIDSYEGRIYGSKYHPDNPNNPIQKGMKSGQLIDTGYNSSTTGYDHGRGMEHFAHSVSRYANALHSYKKWKQSNPDSKDSIDDWAGKMSDQFKSRGYGTDWDAERTEGDIKSYKDAAGSYQDESNGFLYHTMMENHKSMGKALNRLLNRSDFQHKGVDTGAMTQRYEQGDFVRKGETPLIVYVNGGVNDEGSH